MEANTNYAIAWVLIFTNAALKPFGVSEEPDTRDSLMSSIFLPTTCTL